MRCLASSVPSRLHACAHRPCCADKLRNTCKQSFASCHSATCMLHQAALNTLWACHWFLRCSLHLDTVLKLPQSVCNSAIFCCNRG